MGILSRWFETRLSAPTKAEPTVAVTASVAASVGGLVKLSGTTTFAKQAIGALLERRDLVPPVMLECQGVLQREPGNKADSQAVAVLIDGERVAYLPGYVARAVELPAGASALVPTQLFAIRHGGEVRAEAWAWLGPGAPQWEFGEEDWPPLTTQERQAAEHTSRRAMVASALADGGQRAEHFRAGMVNGVHYLELVEPIKQLKREGRLEEALELCYAAIAGAEGDRSGTPPPWYPEQAAIVLRKLGRREEEAQVLRRYLDHLPAAQRTGSRIAERLANLQMP